MDHWSLPYPLRFSASVSVFAGDFHDYTPTAQCNFLRPSEFLGRVSCHFSEFYLRVVWSLSSRQKLAFGSCPFQWGRRSLMFLTIDWNGGTECKPLSPCDPSMDLDFGHLLQSRYLSLNIRHGFLKLLVKIQKVMSSGSQIFLFQLVSRNKN